MDLLIPETVFSVVFLTELPDKTALASLILGSRHRPLFVFAGHGRLQGPCGAGCSPVSDQLAARRPRCHRSTSARRPRITDELSKPIGRRDPGCGAGHYSVAG